MLGRLLLIQTMSHHMQTPLKYSQDVLEFITRTRSAGTEISRNDRTDPVFLGCETESCHRSHSNTTPTISHQSPLMACQSLVSQ